MARKHSKKRTLKQRQRKHRQRAGGWGFTGNASIPGTPGTVSNPMVYTGIGDCRATEPGYTIPVSQYGASMKGLPGMSGGGKKTRKGRKGKTRKHRQRGGRYGFFPEGDVNPSGQAWWAGSYAPIQRIACEGTTQNPLNPTHTPSSAPPGAAPPNYFFNVNKGGLMSGGGQQMAPATYGVGNVDSMYYYAPTAGYANTASTWTDSVGAPVQLQVPVASREMNQACLSTGGHPPLTGALQRGGKRSRKQRGGEGFWNLPGVGILSGLFGNNRNNNNANNNNLNGNVNNGAPAPGAPAPGAPAANVNPGGNVFVSAPTAAPVAPAPVDMDPVEPPRNSNPGMDFSSRGGRRNKKSRKHRKGKHSRKY